MNKTAKEVFEDRIKLIRATLNHEKTDRVPIMANTQNWMYIDAGYTVLEAARDYDKCLDSGRKFIEKYKVDAMNCGAGVVRNPTQLYDALGQNNTWAAAGNENNINAIFEDDMIRADEYDEMISNYEKTIFEKAFFRTFPAIKDFTIEQWVAATKAARDFNGARWGFNLKLREEYGIADAVNTVGISTFVNNLMDTYRGLKGLSLDLRRQKEKVYEICAQRDQVSLDAFFKGISAFDGPDMNEPYDVTTYSLAHIILRRDQFEQLYMPVWSKVAAYCGEHGKNIFMNTEGQFVDRFSDYFNEFAKGVLTTFVEMDDPIEVRKKCPGLGICSGLNVDIMGNGTPEECVDMAKRTIDEVGRDGGLWIAPNKFVTYDYDMKPENLKAVCDFVVDYKI